MGVGLLLEGFAPSPAAADFPGAPFTSGDQVRVSAKGAQSIVGRVVRPHGGPPATHAVIAPEGGGAHVLAPVAAVALNTPAQHAQIKRRRDAAAAKQAQQQMQAMRSEPGKPGVPKLPASGSMLEGMLEAFAPAETPQQSAAIAQGQYTQAQKSLSSGWSAAKHPRGAGGKFGYTTGGKRATSTTPRTLRQGASGSLVKSIQRQLGLPADGIYGPNTKAAVVRFQQQHRLQVDGIVGRQTLAALRGQKPQTPGLIGTKAARIKAAKVKTTKTKVAKPKAPPAPVRLGGGVMVP